MKFSMTLSMKVWAPTNTMKQGFFVYYIKDDDGNVVSADIKPLFANDWESTLELFVGKMIKKIPDLIFEDAKYADLRVENYKEARIKAYEWLVKKGFIKSNF